MGALPDEASVNERILRHRHPPTEAPAPRPGLVPPLLLARSFDEDTGGLGLRPMRLTGAD